MSSGNLAYLCVIFIYFRTVHRYFKIIEHCNLCVEKLVSLGAEFNIDCKSFGALTPLINKAC